VVAKYDRKSGSVIPPRHYIPRQTQDKYRLCQARDYCHPQFFAEILVHNNVGIHQVHNPGHVLVHMICLVHGRETMVAVF